MTKAKTKTTKVTKRSNAKKTQPAPKDFQRWLLPSLLTIVFYLFTSLIAALYIKSDGGITPEGGILVSILWTLTLLSALWWLIESARWTMNYIERRTNKKK